MRVGATAAAGNGGESSGISDRFQKAMMAEGGKGAAAAPVSGPASAPAMTTGSMTGILEQIQQLVQQLAQLIQSMSKGGKSDGGSSIGTDGQVKSVGSATDNTGGLGGSQGPSSRIPDPTQDVREVQLGSKTMTIGSDGNASAAEVDTAANELQRMYDASPTFRESIESSTSDTLTVTLGRRGDNTSWGGGARVFLNLNNISAGNNDRFQGIVGHEFAHASNGLGHGAELDAIEDRVRAEA